MTGQPNVPDLITIGTPDVDYIVHVPYIPEFGEKIHGKFVARTPGGTMPNVACAFAQLGGTAGWIGALGDDEGADLMMDGFEAYSVDASLVERYAEEVTPFTYILVGPNGERSILIARTLSDQLSFTDKQRKYFEEARFLYTAPHELDFITQLLSTVSDPSNRLILEIEETSNRTLSDCNWILSSAYIVVLTREGLAQLLAKRALSRAPFTDLVPSINELKRSGIHRIVVTLGAEGCLLTSPEHTGVVHIPAIAVDPVDTTGAGDCFNGAFIWSLNRGSTLTQAARFATASAAFAVTRDGVRAAFPRRRDVDTLFGDYPKGTTV